MNIPEAEQSPDRGRAELEAVAWFTRMNGNPSEVEKRDFAAWLKGAPEHEGAYGDLSRLWATLGPLTKSAQTDRDELSGALERIGRYRRRGRTGAVVAAIAGCLAIAVTGAWIWLERPNLLQDLSADHVTARAERRTITLADNSTVLLDADTAIMDESAPGMRRIRVLRGTASFSVQPSDIPFVVDAQGGEARVFGTQFNVALVNSERVRVTLASGSLEVAQRAGADKVRLRPGESVEYGATGLGPVRRVDLQESLAWHDGRLVFTDARLADVLAQIGRYRQGRIVLIGAELGETRVSGNISLENTDAALAAVQASVGFRMSTIGNRLTLVRNN
ncbi:hypothetical protein FALB51S_04161 [Frigidibacter albus]